MYFAWYYVLVNPPRMTVKLFKLQPAIFPLSQHVIRFQELPADIGQFILCIDIV